MLKVLTRLFDANERELKRFQGMVEKINLLEAGVKDLSWEKLTEKTSEFKRRHERGETLDDLLPETFAVVREAIRREIGERAFDVQLMAAIALHEGKIAEQKTGEGKTHSAAFALYLNALTGRGVHYVSVNDYLARRDAGWYAKALNKLGMSIGILATSEESFLLDLDYVDPKEKDDERLRHLKPVSKSEAYGADITFGVNSEFGFDYLRDNMATRLEDVKQRGFYYGIVDEVDSILIDEARTPHIISMPDVEATDKYYQYAKLAEQLNPDLDFVIDEKLKTANLTEHGISKVEKRLGIDNIYEKDFEAVYHIEAALKARTLYLRDRDYVVKDGEVVIVDEFTGRLMPGRRWSEGIHQAVEAKEGVSIQQESKTLAAISLQNYFRKYEKLAGMTGTAVTEAEEFDKIYGLKVVVVPTNKPMIREDFEDVVYKTTRAKYAAIVKEIEESHWKGRPVLVGTTSIEKNEIISAFLKKKGIVHQVLNAKNHEKEAGIIAQAGKLRAVTVATNMAGRGVDIVLGGAKAQTEDLRHETGDKSGQNEEREKWQEEHEKVVKLGGLHVIGTERHESRRIDNQLRGRAGRQGDPGSSHFFVALDDDIMRLFGGDKIAGLMTRFNLPEDQPLEHRMVSRAIESAQSKVESFYFDIRKRQVEYDDILNKQRDIIYDWRRRILREKNLREMVQELIEKELAAIVKESLADGLVEEETDKILNEVRTVLPVKREELELKELIKSEEGLEKRLIKIAEKEYEKREEELGEEMMREIEKWIYLGTIDNFWMNHLTAINDLREGVRLRAYAQKDPLVEFKQEAFSAFERLMAQIDYEVARRIFRVRVVQRPRVNEGLLRTNLEALQAGVAGPRGERVMGWAEAQINQSVDQAARAGEVFLKPAVETPQPKNRDPKTGKKMGRNEPCWCGSGKKFKKCHGR